MGYLYFMFSLFLMRKWNDLVVFWCEFVQNGFYEEKITIITELRSGLVYVWVYGESFRR